jgi:hypothetical protein
MPVVINGHANGIAHLNPNKAHASESSSTLLSKFVESHKELESYKYVDDHVACYKSHDFVEMGNLSRLTVARSLLQR